MNEEIRILICKAHDWRLWEERQITGENDDFLLQEFKEHLEEWGLLYRIWTLTETDNEYLKYADMVWEEVTALELAIRREQTWWKKGKRKILRGLGFI